MTNDLANRHRNEKERGRGYVSEFTRFMEQYLDEHPEVVRDRQVGFNIFWNRKVDLKALAQAEKDSEPNDSYGFAYSLWQRRKDRRPTTTGGGEAGSGSPKTTG